jgi:hypothetical protein
MNPPSTRISAAATPAIRTVDPWNRARATRSRRPPSRPRTQNRLAATPSSSAHAAQYSLNHTNGAMNGPKPFMSEYVHPGSIP